MNRLSLYGALSAIAVAGLCSAAQAQTPVAPLIALPAAQDQNGTPPAQQQTTPPATQPNRQENETPKEQAKKRRVPQFGPQIGFYIPTNDRARRAFGDAWFNYGVGFRPLRLETARGTTSFDISIFSARRSGASATVIPISAMYKVAIGGTSDVEGEADRGLRPYVGVSLGLYVADLRSDRYDVSSGWQGAFGGSALIGTTYQRNVYLEARYHIISEMKTFDISGFNVSLGARF